MGLEPTRCYHHTDLNRARLPIPPLLHICLRPAMSENLDTKRKKCGRWDLNPHGLAATRSLVLLVCQFRHFRLRS